MTAENVIIAITNNSNNDLLRTFTMSINRSEKCNDSYVRSF